MLWLESSFQLWLNLITLPPSLSLVLWIPVVSREELVGEANRSKQRLISPPPSSKPTSPSSPQTNTHDINALPQCAALRSFIYLFLNACATFLYGFNCFYTFVPVSRTCLHTCTDTRDVIKPSMSRRGSCRRGHVQKACDLSCGLSELWYQCVFTGWWLCLLKPAEEWHDRDFPSRATKAQCECAACMLTYTILFHCQHVRLANHRSSSHHLELNHFSLFLVLFGPPVVVAFSHPDTFS